MRWPLLSSLCDQHTGAALKNLESGIKDKRGRERGWTHMHSHNALTFLLYYFTPLIEQVDC